MIQRNENKRKNVGKFCQEFVSLTDRCVRNSFGKKPIYIGAPPPAPLETPLLILVANRARTRTI